MEFKVGDKVIVKNYEQMKKDLKGNPSIEYPCFTEEMYYFIGSKGTIVSVEYKDDKDILCYYVTFQEKEKEELNEGYLFTDWMLTKIEDNENIISINLNDFSNYEQLDNYLRDRTCDYFDTKVAREEFLKLEPTYEEIQILKIARTIVTSLAYEDNKCYIYYNGANRIPALDRFSSIMNKLEYTNNVYLPINLLLGKEDEEND